MSAKRSFHAAGDEKMPNALLSSVATALLLTACGNDQLFQTDRMSGCYADDSGKAAGMRVLKDSGRFQFALPGANAWQVHPESLRAATAADLRSVFGADTVKVVESLVAPEGGLGLFRLKQGSTLGGKTLNTDYVAFLLLVAVPVYKVECP